MGRLMKQEFFFMHCHNKSGGAQPELFGNFLAVTGLAGAAGAAFWLGVAAAALAAGFCAAGWDGSGFLAAGGAGVGLEGAGAGISSLGSSAMQQSSS
mmetsp:Transcript_29113/g.53099  ORF Transcript_29113/g.53099 Transcript_29113/m.53099 type:complete len:97 (+) Transcript_29113:432-722(+)